MRDRVGTVLTRQVRHGAELLLPVLRHLDGLLLHVLALASQALLGGVLDDLLQVVRLQRVEYVEEVLSWRSLAFRVLVGEVALKDRVLSHRRVDVLDTELLVVWHFDEDHVRPLEQLLLPGEHLLDEVLGHDRFVRQVELD